MDLEVLLETYSLADILEENDVTEEEVLEFLLRHDIVRLPETLPINLEN